MDKEINHDKHITSYDNIILLDNYIGDKKQHNVQCTICNHIWATTPNYLKRKNNSGCPQCNKVKKLEDSKITLEQKKLIVKKVEKLPGSQKLKNGSTLPRIPLVDSVDIREKKVTINTLESGLANLIRLITSLENDLKLKRAALDNSRIGAWEFDVFALILLPLWIVSYFIQEKKEEPYRNAFRIVKENLEKSQNDLRLNRNEISRLQREIEYEKEKTKHKNNIHRLKDRLNIELGGRTNLYYFRFKWHGRDYYKIGISKNGVGSRYTKWDGTGSLAIDEVFFDLSVYNTHKLEKLILNAFHEYKANDPEILGSYNGWSEVFTKDVLELDR